MSARLLLEVALRVFGIWFVFNSITSLAATAPFFLGGFWNSSLPDMAGYLMGYGVTFAVQFALGAALIFWAPGIAAKFYPPDVENEDSRIGFGPGDVYRTACFVLGVYLLVQAVQPACRVVIASLQASNANLPSRLAGDVVTTIVYTVVGILLIFGSSKIGEWFSSLRHDPNTIPKQQFTIAAILIVTVLFAVCLAVIRRIMVGGL